MTLTNQLRNGYVVIFSNEEFTTLADSTELNIDMPGYATDALKLEQCFREHLGFDEKNIDIVRNKTAQEILTIMNCEVPDMLKDMHKHSASALDYFVCIILTHGYENGVLFGKDLKPFHLRDLMKPILGCSALSTKPKIFIVQACKGDKAEIRNSSMRDQRTQANLGCSAKDTLVAYATTEGYIAWVDNTCCPGSCFIWHLCKTIQKLGQSMDLVELFTSVNHEMAHQGTFCGEVPRSNGAVTVEVKQMSCFESALRKRYELVGNDTSHTLANALQEYPHTKYRGRAIIINNKSFPRNGSVPNTLKNISQPHLNHREGTEMDVKALTECFTGTFHFSEADVIVYEDQTSQQMKEIIKAENGELEKMDGSLPDCFICVILTHGITQEYVYGSDGNFVHISELIQQIQECSQLELMPKIFLVQAYATVEPKEDESGYKSELWSAGDDQQWNFYLPSQANKLVVYGPSKEPDGWVRATNGSKFIKRFCEVCEEKKRQPEDFVKILTLLNENPESQLVSFLSSLTKRLIL